MGYITKFDFCNKDCNYFYFKDERQCENCYKNTLLQLKKQCKVEVDEDELPNYYEKKECLEQECMSRHLIENGNIIWE